MNQAVTEYIDQKKKGSCMLGINFLAVVVAAVAAFVVSSVWYIVFGKELAKVSAAFAEALQKPQPWKMLVVIVQSLVLALVLAYFIGLIGDVGWMGAVRVGVLLWIGLSAMQWVGSIMWEKVPWKMAAIHAGDWLVKLVVIAVIVGVWR
jgi:hypothetical protein